MKYPLFIPKAITSINPFPLTIFKLYCLTRLSSSEDKIEAKDFPSS